MKLLHDDLHTKGLGARDFSTLKGPIPAEASVLLELTFDSELPLSVPWPGFRAAGKGSLLFEGPLSKISGTSGFIYGFGKSLGPWGLGFAFCKASKTSETSDLGSAEALGFTLSGPRVQAHLTSASVQVAVFGCMSNGSFVAFGWTRKPQKGETSTQIQKKRNSNTTNQTKPPFRKPPIKIPTP